jgi:hypothetical protein
MKWRDHLHSETTVITTEDVVTTGIMTGERLFRTLVSRMLRPWIANMLTEMKGCAEVKKIDSTMTVKVIAVAEETTAEVTDVVIAVVEEMTTIAEVMAVVTTVVEETTMIAEVIAVVVVVVSVEMVAAAAVDRPRTGLTTYSNRMSLLLLTTF